MINQQLISFLNQKVLQYNRPDFIPLDPISVPHQFSTKQDIEIAGFFAASLAWGNRTTIINNAQRIMHAMNSSPYDFIMSHQSHHLKNFIDIKHRTFNATDLLYFIHFLQWHYANYDSLEDAFILNNAQSTKQRLINFHNYFFSLEHPLRTCKHIATPFKHSACKRLNMFLRWMVRKDEKGVDFGLWSRIPMSQLICPLDIHVSNVAHRLGLLQINKANWQAAETLTDILSEFDELDPCKYDFALFGLGAEERLR